jgi:hypothetical protein
MLTSLKETIVTKLNPDFLSILHNTEGDSPFIHIVISKKNFKNKLIEERVKEVYDVLMKDTPLMQPMKLPIIVEAFSEEELLEVMESFNDK